MRLNLLDVNQQSESHNVSNPIEPAVHTRMEMLILTVITNSLRKIWSEKNQHSRIVEIDFNSTHDDIRKKTAQQMRSERQSAVRSFTYTFDDLREFTVENE